jgi:hypothetical protein
MQGSISHLEAPHHQKVKFFKKNSLKEMDMSFLSGVIILVPLSRWDDYLENEIVGKLQTALSDFTDMAIFRFDVWFKVRLQVLTWYPQAREVYILYDFNSAIEKYIDSENNSVDLWNRKITALTQSKSKVLKVSLRLLASPIQCQLTRQAGDITSSVDFALKRQLCDDYKRCVYEHSYFCVVGRGVYPFFLDENGYDRRCQIRQLAIFLRTYCVYGQFRLPSPRLPLNFQ